ncbi:MAG: hypothetical protein OIF36_03850 [Alphaproteobacteria bacterium]|nr:hypothetical protein [Alphaproteobacteria bacterium]
MNDEKIIKEQLRQDFDITLKKLKECDISNEEQLYLEECISKFIEKFIDNLKDSKKRKRIYKNYKVSSRKYIIHNPKAYQQICFGFNVAYYHINKFLNKNHEDECIENPNLKRSEDIMENVNFIETVRERDMDLLIMEEIFSSEEFRTFLLSKFDLSSDNVNFWGCWHSVMDNELGETDVLVGFKTLESKRIVIMLENKIDVSFQPMQPERYVFRGEKGIKDGLWDEFHLCITAPDLYIQNVDRTKFPISLSYEEIIDTLKGYSANDDRISFKINMLETAIDKKKRGYSFITNTTVSEFWQRYYDLIEEEYPKLANKRPANKPTQSDWYYFRKPIMELPFAIVHKWEFGFIDLQIRGYADKFKAVEEIVTLPNDAMLVKTGKSLNIRKRCSSINKLESFDEQKDLVKEALDKVEELVLIYKEYRDCILAV